MKRRFQMLGLAATSVLVTLLLFEGGYALARGARPGTSLLFRALEGIGHRGAPRFVTPQGDILADVEPIEALLPSLLADGVGVGNSRFRELSNERTRMHVESPGCKLQKPDLDKSMTFLRTPLYDPFMPLTAQWDHDAVLSPEVKGFLDRYGTRRIRHRSNGDGERWTLPRVQAGVKVLVAGDSVANGAFVNDDETLASQLQAADAGRQYVNAGVSGADADEVLCSLENALARYRGQVKALVYVYCENDFQPEKPLGSPEPVMEKLAAVVAREGIESTVVVYAPAVYNVLPQRTRFRGYHGDRFPNHADERARLERAAREAGFAWVDFASLALREAEHTGTDYAALGLFIDVMHWSPLGALRLAEYLHENAGL